MIHGIFALKKVKTDLNQEQNSDRRHCNCALSIIADNGAHQMLTKQTKKSEFRY